MQAQNSAGEVNNRVEQGIETSARLTKPGMIWVFQHSTSNLRGFEAMNMIRKGNFLGIDKGDVQASIQLVSQLWNCPRRNRRIVACP